MIIRPVCRKEYVALPNALFNDRRLSADTRAMIALLLSKPRGWELRPFALAKLLSRQNGRPVGRTRLNRLFEEATEGGYMARSADQAHNEDGTWGKYEYFVGMPDDVLRAIQQAGVAIAPQPCDRHADEPHTANDYTNHKEQTLKSTDLKNESLYHHQPLQLEAAPERTPKERSKGHPRRRTEGQEIVQNRVAVRLGRGDVAVGWLLLGALDSARRDTLTALERAGRLGEDELSAAQAGVVLAGLPCPQEGIR